MALRDSFHAIAPRIRPMKTQEYLLEHLYHLADNTDIAKITI